MLTDKQIEELCQKMSIPLEGIYFKDELPKKIEYGKSYFINLDDEYDEKGHLNSGSHWTCLQTKKYPDGKIESIFFDPFGIPPSENIKKFVKDNTGKNLPFSTKDIQSLMNNACGWFCCAFLHFVNASIYRSGDLYTDTANFLDLFDDLNESIDWKKNEWVLKHFFQSQNPILKKEIDVISDINNITKQDEDKGTGLDISKISSKSISKKKKL